MPKARANGTPAKKASPAKGAKSQTTTPDQATRRSPRHATLSLKAQEAAATADRVQAGRVTKKTSPAKAKATPKKASLAKAKSPAKKASPAKAKSPANAKSPAKKSPTKAATPTKKETPRQQEQEHAFSDREWPQVRVEGALQDPYGAEAQEYKKHVLRKMIQYRTRLITDTRFVSMIDLENSYTLLRDCYFRHFRPNKKDEVANPFRAALNPTYRKLKESVEHILQRPLDGFLENDVDEYEFIDAVTCASGEPPDTEELERDSIPAFGYDDFTSMSAEILKFRYAGKGNQIQKQPGDRRVAKGRVTKPASRAASQSRSPTKGRSWRSSDTSTMSRPVRARSQSPAKASTRQASVAPPASRAASRTRSKSPAKSTTQQRTRSPSVPSPSTTKRTRATSPTKAASDPLVTSRARSKSPAKAASEKPVATRARSKSPAKRSASQNRSALSSRKESSDPAVLSSDGRNAPPNSVVSSSSRSKSPARTASEPISSARTKSKSPAKTASEPIISARARSKSPTKRSGFASQQGLSGASAKAFPAQVGRGTIISASNLPTIAELNHKLNPFHETLPAPEVWHRNMPPYFPFGETKFMEQELSRQINGDLQRGMQETREAAQKNDGILKTSARFVSNAWSSFTSPPKKTKIKYPPQWAPPKVPGVQGYTDEEVLAMPSPQPLYYFKSPSKKKKKKSSIHPRRDEDEDDDSDDDISLNWDYD